MTPEPVKALEAFRVVPEKERPVPKTVDCRFLLASDITRLEAVKVARLKLPAAVNLAIEVPVEEAMLKMSLVPAVPWMLKPMLEEVAFMPITVPLSMSLPVVREVAPFQIETKPLVPAPDRPLPAAAKLIWPAVVVVMVMLLPATRLVGPYLVPVESAARICPVTLGALLVLVPPLATVKTPLTSLPPKAIAPLNRAPVAVLLTGRAEERDDSVVDPLVATCRKEAPVVEATVKIGKVWAEEEA